MIYLLEEEKQKKIVEINVIFRTGREKNKVNFYSSKCSDLFFSRSDSLNRTNANAEGRDYSGIVCSLIAVLRSCKC